MNYGTFITTIDMPMEKSTIIVIIVVVTIVLVNVAYVIFKILSTKRREKELER